MSGATSGRMPNREAILSTEIPKAKMGCGIAHLKWKPTVTTSQRYRSVALSRWRPCCLIIPPSKYLDSHLRPFVCAYHECGSLRFSSNAYLFRHQREAHGLHCYGENPHLCHFSGCERALERNGFPRKWNLKDHMKRVHGWEESEDSPSSDSPSGPSHKSGQPVQKRKGTPPIASVLVKR